MTRFFSLPYGIVYAGVMDYIAFHPFLRTGSGSLSGPFLLVGVWLKHLLKGSIRLKHGRAAAPVTWQALADCVNAACAMGYMFPEQSFTIRFI